MVLDSLIKRWCEERYDTSREEDYQAYAQYVALYPWLRGLRLHRIFLWLVFVALVIVNNSAKNDYSFDAISPALQLIMSLNCACTLAFVAYGFKKFHLKDGTTLFFYCCMVAALLLVDNALPGSVQTIVHIVMIPVSVALHYVWPISKSKYVRRMKKFYAAQMRELEDAEDEFDRAEFDSWAYRKVRPNTSDFEEVQENGNYKSLESECPPAGMLEMDTGAAYKDLNEAPDEFIDEDPDEFTDADPDEFPDEDDQMLEFEDFFNSDD